MAFLTLKFQFCRVIAPRHSGWLPKRGRNSFLSQRLGTALLLNPGWLLLPLSFMSPRCAIAQQASREYQIKAVFLFNFAQFTDWPADTFTNKEQPIVIGVLGPNPFGSFLEATVKNETVRGHPLSVKHCSTIEQCAESQILYIGQSEAGRLEQVVNGLKGRAILTVADIEKAAERGAMIRFATERNRIRLQINLEAVRSSNLAVSSKLLRLGDIVSANKQ